MGKTTLAVLLLRELVERPDREDAVPVFFSLSDWNFERETLARVSKKVRNAGGGANTDVRTLEPE
jgi:hypothetical protein